MSTPAVIRQTRKPVGGELPRPNTASSSRFLPDSAGRERCVACVFAAFRPPRSAGLYLADVSEASVSRDLTYVNQSRRSSNRMRRGTAMARSSQGRGSGSAVAVAASLQVPGVRHLSQRAGRLRRRAPRGARGAAARWPSATRDRSVCNSRSSRASMVPPTWWGSPQLAQETYSPRSSATRNKTPSRQPAA